MKRPHVINTEKVGRFTIRVHTRPYTSATDVKAQYGKQCSLVEAFKCYDNPLTYKNKLIEANISSNQIYRMFVAVEYDTLNASGLKSQEENVLSLISYKRFRMRHCQIFLL